LHAAKLIAALQRKWQSGLARATGRTNESMIRKNGYRFSEKIMLQRKI
jgi:hypothetical protein